MKDTIENAYNYLQEATGNLYQRVEVSIDKKSLFETAVANAYANGEVVGKNQAERDGWIAEHFFLEIQAMMDAQAAEREAKFQHDLARIGVDKVRALLRLMELTK